MATAHHTFEVITYTDPYCTWCWGGEPILKKIEEVFGWQVKIIAKMGGLVADMKTFRDRIYDIGGPQWYVQVADHWLEASQRHGMPVDEQIYYDLKDGAFSTYPASIAYKAAEFQGQELAGRYLRRLREAAAAERRDVQRLDVQLELAREVGLDPDCLVSDLRNGRARLAFESDLEERRTYRVHEFPTFRVRNARNGKELILRGPQQFSSFVTAFDVLADGPVTPQQPTATARTITAFVRKYGKVAPREIAVVFMVPENTIDKHLKVELEEGIVCKVKAGNGYFYTSQPTAISRLKTKGAR